MKSLIGTMILLATLIMLAQTSIDAYADESDCEKRAQEWDLDNDDQEDACANACIYQYNACEADHSQLLMYVYYGCQAYCNQTYTTEDLKNSCLKCCVNYTNTTDTCYIIIMLHDAL